MNSETPISLLDAALYELDACEWPGCPEPATVHHLGSEMEFCNRHFRERIMTASDLKYIPCEKCGGPPCTYGSGLPRSVFYLTDRVEVRCNNSECGDVLTFMKLRPSAGQKAGT